MELKLSLSLPLITTNTFHHRRLSFLPKFNPLIGTFTVRHSLSTAIRDNLQSETLKTLEWNRLCTHLSPFTSTSMGHSAALTGLIPMGRTLEESRRLLAQTTAALDLPCQLDFAGIDDVSGIVASAVAGEVLSIGELCLVKRTLRSATRVLEQLEGVCSGHRSHPLLEVLQKCNFLVELEQKIEFCVDCSLSIVLDRASDDLKFYRSERRQNMDDLDSLMKSISQKIFQAGGIDRPLVTNRRSRMCVAIKASHRSLLPDGVVLNVSSSGATYFMEPREAVDLNNMEVMLSNSEKDEERAILSLLASELGKSAEQVNDLLSRIQEVDLAVARAGYARWLDAVCPILNPVTADGALLVDIEGVQHPLLLEQALGSSKDFDHKASITHIRELPNEVHDFPVPINIKIRRGANVVIISGPNAGGKTASMKTLGLVSLMAKAGFYLPAKSLPKLPWFDLVLADIGDHQSLEQSLSTFSGHILRICKILDVVSKDSLVLIDEIGSGTDPSEGVALSASILQYIKDRVNLAVVTTHYADLSRLQEIDARFENAAMEFSLDTLQPTYQVLWGCAGESNALRIARRIGFDSKVIDRAESWLERLMPEKQAQRKGQLYQSLLEERNRMESRAKEAALLHSDVMDLYHEIKGEAHDIDWRQKALIAKETQQVEKELELVESQIKNVVKEFENQLRIVDIDQYGSLVKKAELEIASLVASHSPIINRVSGEKECVQTLKPGDQVYVKRLEGKLATVVEVCEDDGTVLIQYGKVRIRVEKSGIKAINEDMAGSSHQRIKKQAPVSGNIKLMNGKKEGEQSYGPMIRTSKNTVDLRGMKMEEASRALNMAIAAWEPYSLLFVVHGMGTGVIKERAIEILKNHPRIVKFEQESPMNYGCTVAFVK
ncbi:uncharacterized protein LOC141642701 [Silene latifolia]|uniref:uncharacterized protein LOC141642701 n=1 Tax=Silene latifolia TaxID=37657 RepID=UPI003D76F2C1